MPDVADEIRSPLPRDELKRLIRSLPRALAGKGGRADQLGRVFHAAFTQAMFDQLYRAFGVKSRGGTDDLGYRWPPLARSTISQRPLGTGDVSRFGVGHKSGAALDTRTRGLLTPDQDRKWRAIYASTLAKLSAMGEAKAASKAAELAWAILKSEGALTRLQVLGGRTVPILDSSGRLKASLAPGGRHRGRYYPPKEQIAEFQSGRLILGTTVPYASYVNKRRPIIPPTRRMGLWIRRAASRAGAALHRELRERLRSAA
jgi:hypothetical protein